MPITLYTAATGNGAKPLILLEELGIPYKLSWIDIMADDQFAPDFLKISPNNKIPALVDDGVSVFESGAILLHLAEKHGKFWSNDSATRISLMQWMFFQAGTQGPMLGQAHHFRQYAPEKISYGIERYTKEAQRIYGVMDRWLSERTYFGGEDYTIVDMMCFPWTVTSEWQGVEIAEFPHVLRWREMINERPAVQKSRAIIQR